MVITFVLNNTFETR